MVLVVDVHPAKDPLVTNNNRNGQRIVLLLLLGQRERKYIITSLWAVKIVRVLRLEKQGLPRKQKHTLPSNQPVYS